MGCCGSSDTKELNAREKSNTNRISTEEIENALGNIENENVNNVNSQNVLKLAGNEYMRTDPEKNFVESSFNITAEYTNKGTAIMNYNHDSKSINLREIRDFCDLYLNNEKINFNFEYNFPKEGKYNFKLTYKCALLNTSNMFFNCKTLLTLDLSNFDSSYVKNMGSMFYGCRNLQKINLSNFKTDKVTYMSNMFAYCISLTELDLSSFNTINVTNMGNMFQDCSSLISLNIQNFNSKNITFMNNMFSGVNKKCKIICNDQKILSQF